MPIGSVSPTSTQGPGPAQSVGFEKVHVCVERLVGVYDEICESTACLLDPLWTIRKISEFGHRLRLQAIRKASLANASAVLFPAGTANHRPSSSTTRFKDRFTRPLEFSRWYFAT